MERDYIMKVVCKSTLAPEAKIRKAVVKEDEESVALQAIKFWSLICDKEIDILEEYGDFVEEDQDHNEGSWNIAMAGGTCLGLVARTIGDDIVPHVMPFIEKNIRKPDWRQRERDIVPLVMPLIVTTCKVAGISTVRACLAKLMSWAYASVI
nr:importin subunit beta-1 [Tanacetum cinerariifolium]